MEGWSLLDSYALPSKCAVVESVLRAAEIPFELKNEHNHCLGMTGESASYLEIWIPNDRMREAQNILRADRLTH